MIGIPQRRSLLAPACAAAFCLLGAASASGGGAYSLLQAGSIGGAGGEQSVRDVAVDRHGNIYLTGGTQSDGFPVTEGAFDTSADWSLFTEAQFGQMNAFVMKIDPQGKVLWSTYLGGPQYDRSYAIRVDSDGFVYVAGRAGKGFPTTAGSLQPEFAGDSETYNRAYGDQDGFVAKLAPDGGSLVWSTYFGDDGSGFIRDMDIDGEGNVYIGLTGVTGELAHITPNAAQPRLRGVADAVIAKISSDGKRVFYATYLGGTEGARAEDGVNTSIAVSDRGEVYAVMLSDTDDIAVTPGAFQPRRAGETDYVVAKYAADGQLVFATYLGGSGREDLETHHMALDLEGNPVIASGTASKDFPMPGAQGPRPFDARHSGPYDSVIVKLSADGRRLLAGTYLGGGGTDMIEGITVAPSGEILVAGSTGSGDFPVTGGALQDRLRGRYDFHHTRLKSDLSAVAYATYFGGTGIDFGRGIAVSPSGQIVIGGITTSADFPQKSFDRGSAATVENAAYIKLAPN